MPLREIRLIPRFLHNAPSCLAEFGGTRVLCTASVSPDVPPFLNGTGKGWLTAEYAMLPASTSTRKPRDTFKRDGRGVEISRLIGRSLRQAVDLRLLGQHTVTIDCDVLEADGGTRTAAITGGFVALALAVEKLVRSGELPFSPLVRQVAAISVGVVDGEPVVDLCYAQDSRAEVDMNVVLDDEDDLIEIQGSAEKNVFSRPQLDRLLDLAQEAVHRLLAIQREALGDAARLIRQEKRPLLAATHNANKVRELKALLGPRGYDVRSLDEAGIALEVEETGATFEENARLKAETLCRLTGLETLADDSGLSVDALGGEPGVRSARYAGVHGDDAANLHLLLERLEGVPDPRGAHFACAMALARPGQETLVVTGRADGTIAHAPSGSGGFGYDPVFVWQDGRTFAEMPEEEKNAVSHRADAIRRLLEAL